MGSFTFSRSRVILYGIWVYLVGLIMLGGAYVMFIIPGVPRYGQGATSGRICNTMCYF